MDTIKVSDVLAGDVLLYHGNSLMELIVAMALLSIIALALTTTMVACHKARLVSERWLRATFLAVEGVEQLYAGQNVSDLAAPTIFTRSSKVEAAAGIPGLMRLEVTISWNDTQARTLRLATLAYRPAAAVP